MRKYLLFTVVIIVNGCATQLTDQGARVRLVDSQANYKCEFIATVTGSNSMGNNKAHDSQGAMNEMRNRAAELGANAVRLINLDVTYETTTALGEALKCEF